MASICFEPSKSSSATSSRSSPSPEDTRRNLEELQKEWLKKDPNRTHINMLLDQTQEHLASMLKKDDSGRIAPVLTVYPCFEDGRHVSIALFTLM